MLATPKMQVMMPEEMTQRHIGVPILSSEVASLLRLPRIETPRMIIKDPRVTNPEDGDSNGQLLAMYRRNSPISVMMRPTRFRRQ